MNWTELTSLSIDELLNWAAEQSWCRAMASCQQDAGWHSEGDVWTHTQMVCRQLPQLAEWPSLSAHEQTVLIMTALFHDAAKPLTTLVDPESGRVRSPKHAVKGAFLCRSVLMSVNCPVPMREEICGMVRYHGRPAFLLERSQPAHEVVWLSWLVSNKLLYLFAIADTRGRRTVETTRPLENLELWKLVAEENGCYETPFRFANDQARFLFYRQSEPNLHYVPHEDHVCTVTLMSGLPGSGKDTWLKRNRPELPVVSLDDIRGELDIDPTENQGEVAQVARERCRELLRSGTSFAFNATNLLAQTRSRWTQLFTDYNARIHSVHVEPPFSVTMDQNRRRTRPVPEAVMHDLIRKMEPPTWMECHHLSFAGDERFP